MAKVVVGKGGRAHLLFDPPAVLLERVLGVLGFILNTEKVLLPRNNIEVVRQSMSGISLVLVITGMDASLGLVH